MCVSERAPLLGKVTMAHTIYVEGEKGEREVEGGRERGGEREGEVERERERERAPSCLPLLAVWWARCPPRVQQTAAEAQTQPEQPLPGQHQRQWLLSGGD